MSCCTKCGFDVHDLLAERDRYKAALESMLGHVCDGGGERPCSQMWFQDMAEEALKAPDDNRCPHGVWRADRCFQCDPNIGDITSVTSTKADG